jgi:hypothetical protein
VDFCAASIISDAPTDQVGDGGAIPTVALFRKQDWVVAEVSLSCAQQFIRKHHYSKGCSNTRVLTTGLFRRGWFWESDCVGVTLWIPPTNSAARAIAPERWTGVLACSRLVILDEIPTNAESFLLRHSMRFLDRKKWPVLVSYSDSWQGHNGTIYRASGWRDDGQTSAEAVYQLNGRSLSRRCGAYTRTHKDMLQLGSTFVGKFPKTRWIHEDYPA